MGELIVPVLMMLVAIAFYRDAGTLPVYDDGLPMTSASYPAALAGAVMICAAGIILRFFYRRYRGRGETEPAFDPRVLAVFGLFVGFYFGLPFLGYIPCSFVFLVALSLFFQKGRPRLLDTLVLPVCLSVGMFYAFRLMSIYLPTGSLFRGWL
ncbi:MAG: tripartite tricarboxylate transporter TctB family protein [Planctomycetes bacterium]|nr:tripartite tricarboxylate transporter TctB family protein [Planctomycetota bacterium]